MTIAIVAQKYGLTVDTLRYYERVGLIPNVHRTKSGIRDYTEEDCRWVEFIKCMRGAGLPVEVLIEYVALFQKGDSTVPARKELLCEQRELLSARIEELKVTLEKLNRKIDHYDEVLVPCENRLS